MEQDDTKTPKKEKEIIIGRPADYKVIGPPQTRIRKRQFIKLYPEAPESISYACSQIGIQRGTYYRWLANDPEFKRAIDEIEAAITDQVLLSLHKEIRNGDMRGIIYYLNSKGATRGYKNEKNITLATKDDKPLVIIERRHDESRDGVQRSTASDPGSVKG